MFFDLLRAEKGCWVYLFRTREIFLKYIVIDYECIKTLRHGSDHSAAGAPLRLNKLLGNDCTSFGLTNKAVFFVEICLLYLWLVLSKMTCV